MKDCTWAQEPNYGYWDTSCGQSFSLDDGTPKENDMAFCCYCGKKLKERAWEEVQLERATV